jgi:hypothetical protein
VLFSVFRLLHGNFPIGLMDGQGPSGVLSYTFGQELSDNFDARRKTRESIDAMLLSAGWLIQDRANANIRGGLGRAQQVFGYRFLPLLNELNEVLAA